MTAATRLRDRAQAFAIDAVFLAGAGRDTEAEIASAVAAALRTEAAREERLSATHDSAPGLLPPVSAPARPQLRLVTS